MKPKKPDGNGDVPHGVCMVMLRHDKRRKD